MQGAEEQAEYPKQYLVIEDLSKGMNNWDSPHMLEKGFYVHAQNCYLTTRSPQSRGGQIALTTTAAPSSLKVIWMEPYTGSTATTNLFTVLAANAGTPIIKFYTYVIGTDTWVHVFSPPSAVTSLGTFGGIVKYAPFNGLMLVNASQNPASDVASPIFKWNGTNLVPLGSMLVTGFESDEPATTFSGGTGFNTSDFVERARSQQCNGGVTATVTWSPAQNFRAGPGPLGATMWSSNSLIDTAGVGRFEGFVYKHTTTNAVTRFTFTSTVGNDASYDFLTTGASAGWQRFSKALGSPDASTGTIDWTAITKLDIINGGAAALNYDFLTIAHQDTKRPHAAFFLDVYKQQVMWGNLSSWTSGTVSGTATTTFRTHVGNALTNFMDENSGTTSILSGGQELFQTVDHITGLQTYFDQLLAGKFSSSFALSGNSTSGFTTNVVQATIGFDAHRNVIETPWSLMFSYQYNVYGARLTNRSIVSMPVQGTLAGINYASGRIARAIANRDDSRRLVRWGWGSSALTSSTGCDIVLYYDYQLNAWASVGSTDLYAKPAYWCRYIDASGNWQTLVTNLQDGKVYLEDSGTTLGDLTEIAAYVVLPYVHAQTPDTWPHKVQWEGVFVHVDQGAATTTTVQARFADDPLDFFAGTVTTGFQTYRSLTGSSDSDKQYVQLGVSARYCQVKLATAASKGDWKVDTPIVFEYTPSNQRP